MKICWEGFLSKQHSWSHVAQNICRQLCYDGHDVHAKSTNDYVNFPKDLSHLIKDNLENNYDMQLSYTSMINFPRYLSHGNKNRFGIWNYEFTHLPQSHIKYYTFVDKILPSSNFSYQIFANNKIPLEKLRMVHHGIELEKYKAAHPLDLNTNKKFKILANIAQPHIRKNISGLFEVFGKAFTSKDDVCLILKIVDKPAEQPFEVSFKKEFAKFNNKYKKHAECLILRNFIHEMPQLYKACDAVFTMTHAEAFYLPGLEGLAANKIVIAPRYGGQLDFLNDKNSLLINGNKMRAPAEAQYWESSLFSEMFNPDIDDAIEKLRFAYQNKDNLINSFSIESNKILNNFSWKKITNDIINIAK